MDRFLVSEDRECYFSGVVQYLLPKLVSDHCPIMLDGGGLRKDPSPFRFENMWLKDNGFKDLLRTWWLGLYLRGFFSFFLFEKLKAIKANMKIWNKKCLGMPLLEKSQP